MGGAGPFMAWGGVNLTHTFYQLPVAYWAVLFFSNLIIIMFKGNIRDYLKKIRSIS